MGRRDALRAVLFACAPLPALTVGIVTMRSLGVSRLAWATNIAASALGLLVWAIVRRRPAMRRRTTAALAAAVSIAAILLPFASEGMLGVHRWISAAGFRLHASAIVAPLVIACVAAAASHGITGALGIGAACTAILAVQPDAAQATSLAAACAVVLCTQTRQTRYRLLSVALLVAIAAASFVHPDPLSPAVHVEGIWIAASSRGLAWAAMTTGALLLLPVPFFAIWRQRRSPLALALGVYVAMTLLAPAWGTFPVPVMGYGASPILGYFIALAMGEASTAKNGVGDTNERDRRRQ